MDLLFFTLAKCIVLYITPLLQSTLLSISEVDTEIKYVAVLLTNAAWDYLPHINPKKKKKFILDPDLSALCRQSKTAWKRWKDADRPNSGELWSEIVRERRPSGARRWCSEE